MIAKNRHLRLTPRLPGFLAALFSLSVLGLAGCGPIQCPYSQRCAGNVLQTCHDPMGLADQRYQSSDCSQQGLVCTQTAPNVASCTPPPCDSSFVPQCQGSVFYFCYQGYVTGNDCSLPDPTTGCPGTCADLGQGPQCQPTLC